MGDEKTSTGNRGRKIAIYLAQVLLLALAYHLAARLGLSMAQRFRNISPMWPPAGIALSALFLYGRHLFPGVFLGVAVAAVLTPAPVAVTLCIGAGNTAGALVGASLLKHAADFNAALNRVRDVVIFVGSAVLLSAMVPATIGVVSLALNGRIPWSVCPIAWPTWWLGDAMGNLVVAPVLLAWAKGAAVHWTPRRVAEAAALLAALFAICMAVFGTWLGLDVQTRQAPLAYTIFPFLIWVALRFDQKNTATASLLTVAIALWGTIHEHGPFVGATRDGNLLLLQIFMGTVAGTSLVLSAAVMERRAAQYELQQLNAALDHKVAERTVELKQAHAEVERLMAARTREVGAAVHDLGHSIHMIQATVDVAFLELEDAGVDRRLFDDQKERICASLESQYAVVADMRDAAQLESGALVLRPAATDLGALVEKVTAQLSASFRSERCELSIERPPVSLYAYCDPARMSRVLYNVIENALRYTSAYREEGAAVNIAIRQEDGCVACEVCDNGPGIAPENLPALGTLLSRFGPSGGPDGTGQGLRFCRGIVELSRGELDIASEGNGRGTVVTIRMPVAPSGTQE